MGELILTEQLKELESSKASQIEAVFAPMVQMLKSFEVAYNELMKEDQSPDKAKKAKRLRLDIAKIRVSADKERKAQKEEYIRAGKAIQGVYNILEHAVKDKEDKLKEVETYEERLEQERIKMIQVEREAELLKYSVSDSIDYSSMDLGKMSDEVYNNFLSGSKANYEAKIQAEKKAEEDRLSKIEEEKTNKYRRNAMFELGLKFTGESFIYKDINFHWTDLICMSSKEFDKALAGAKARKVFIEKESEMKQEEIRIENERLRKEAEEKRKAEKAPDKEKLFSFAKTLLAGKISVKSDEAKEALSKAISILTESANNL